MNVNEAFPSKYVKAADLQGNIVKVSINHLTYEKIGNDQKLVMYFRGREKGLVLNKTNAMVIAQQFGDDTDNWTGADIELFSAMTTFNGQPVEAIRVRVPARKPATGAAHISPNARARAEQTASAEPDNGFDDTVPF